MTWKVHKVCAECGSDDVFLDASARWDFELQDWVLRDCETNVSWCCDCDAECQVEEVVSTP